MTTAVSEIRWSRCTAVVVISYWYLYEGYYEEKFCLFRLTSIE